ncbi:MAG: hypothetical protein HKN51_17150 [Saprospiraceae bacterium]|nr:hypothetical protein [Saprospiraceae bacterium]
MFLDIKSITNFTLPMNTRYLSFIYLIIIPFFLTGQITYVESPMGYVCGNYDSGGDGVRMRVWPTPISGSNVTFRVRKSQNGSGCSGSGNFGTSGTVRIREGSITGPIEASCSMSSCGGSAYIDLSFNLNFSIGTESYYVTVDAGGFTYWAGPIDICAASTCVDGSNINITNPSSSTVITAGSNYNITWNGSLNGSSCKVALAYRVNNGAWIIIDSSENDDGSYNWSVPSSINSTDVDLIIYYRQLDLNCNLVYDIVSGFDIISPPPPDLKLNSNINITPTSPINGSSMSATVNIKNFGGSTWSGDLAMQLLTSAGAYITDLDLDNGLTINANGSHTLVFSTSSVSSPAGNYKIRIQQRNNSSGSWITTTSNGYQNPKDFTIQAPGSPDLKLNSTITITPSSPINGSSMDATVNIKNFGSASWSGDLAMQLLSSAGAYITDLDLDNGLTINANGTHTLVFSTSSVSSPAGNYKIRIQQRNNSSGPWLTTTPNGYQNPLDFTIQSASSPDLKLNSSISITPSSPITGSSMDATVNIKNFGTATWSGDLVMQLLTSAGAYITDLDLDNSLSISPNGTHTLIFSTASVTSSPGNYQVRIQQRNNSSGPWITTTPNGYQNPLDFTILPVSSPDLKLNSSISITPTSPINGSSMDATVNIKNFGSATWSGDLVMQLLTSAGAYITDLDLDNSLSISANGTHTLVFSTASVTSPAGNYQVRIQQRNNSSGPWITTTPNGYQNPLDFTIQSSSSTDLQLNSSIAVTPTSPINGSSMNATVNIKNFGSATWSGDLVMQLLTSSGAYITDLDLDNGLTINANGSHNLVFNTVSVTSPAGNYQIRVQQRNNSSGPWLTTTPNGYLNPLDFTILDSGVCSSFNDLPSTPPDTEAFEAAQCLCDLGYITPQNGNVNPDSPIIREDLAKVVYYTLYRGDAASPAVDFPVPFTDLDDSAQPYYKYAKALSYLEYDDGISPFNRTFTNFYPGNNIQMRYALKVILEAFDITINYGNGGTIQNVSYGDDAYEYVYTAWQMNLITSPTADATQNAIRRNIFIVLDRLLEYGSCTDCQQDCWPLPNNSVDYFIPGSFTLNSLARSVNMSEGYFDQYQKTSFSIPGKNMVMDFTHMYNSYLLEIPDKLRTVCPLGAGWTHSYNSYIIEQDGSGSIPDMLYVFWPNGSINMYDRNTLNCESLGVFDVMTESGSNIYIKKKNQVEYTFNKHNGIWYLDLIEDRNGNYIDPVLQNGFDGLRRVDRVIDAHGRELEFYYQSGTNFLSRVRDETANRNIYFSVNGDKDLANYTNPKGNITSYDYGTSYLKHYLEEITLPEGNIMDVNYDVNKKLSSIQFPGINQPFSVNVDPNHDSTSPYSSDITHPVSGITTTQEFDLEGRLIEKTVGNTTTEITYNADKLPVSIDYEGQVTDITYDSNGNVLEIDQPLGVTHTYTYNALNDITSYKDPNNNTSTFSYDGNDNLDLVTDNMGFITNHNHNGSGLLTLVSNPEGISTTFNYDIYGNQTAINQPLNIKTNLTYDNVSRLIEIENPEDQITEYNYDVHNLITKLERISTGGNITTDYNYDLNDNLTSIINDANNATTMTYNDRDLLETMTFGNDTKDFEYRDDNLLDKFTRPDGTILNYSYDSQGRVTNDGYSGYTYDSRNNIKTITHNGTTTFNYDALDRISNYKDIYNKTTKYTYDANSNVTQVEYPGNYDVNYVYDDNNRLIQVKFNSNSKIIYYTYFDDGRLKKLTYPNGTYTDYTYDNAGRLKTLITKNSSNNIICSYTYTMDKLGNHTNVNAIEPFTGPPPLTTLTYNGTFNGENEIVTYGGSSFEHNNNGELEMKNGRSLSFDVGGMITSNGNRDYVYDGMKFMKEANRNGTNRRYAWDIRGIGNIIVEYNGPGAALYYYIYGNGLCARVKASNTNEVHYYHGDFRGSTIAMTDINENITHKYQYLPYGEISQYEEADNNNPFKYVGQWGVMHEGGNHYYMRARQYDAEIGRFLSEDPVWNTNLYKYTENNPVVHYDINGQETEVCGWESASYDISHYDYSEELQKTTALNTVFSLSDELVQGAGPAMAIANTVYITVSDPNLTNDELLGNIIGMWAGLAGGSIGVIAGTMVCGPACGAVSGVVLASVAEDFAKYKTVSAVPYLEEYYGNSYYGIETIVNYGPGSVLESRGYYQFQNGMKIYEDQIPQIKIRRDY